MIKVTYTEVKALHPCESGLQSAVKLLGGLKTWNAKPTSFADLRAAGVPPDDLVWLASAMAQKNQDVERRLRLWTADCAARVLHIYEKTGKSPAPRAAIVAARQFARGEISDVARAAAFDVARAAEEAWQFDRFVARMSDDEPEDWPLPSPPPAEGSEDGSREGQV